MTTCSAPDENGNVYCIDNNIRRFTASVYENADLENVTYNLELVNFLPVNENMLNTNYITFTPQNYIIQDPITGQDITLNDFFYTYAHPNTNFLKTNYYCGITGTTNLNGCLHTTSCILSGNSFYMILGGDGIGINGIQIPKIEQIIGSLVDGSVYSVENIHWHNITIGTTNTGRPWLLNNLYFRTGSLIRDSEYQDSCINTCIGNNYIDFNVTLKIVILFNKQQYNQWLLTQNSVPIISPFTIIHGSNNDKPVVNQHNKPNNIIIFPGKQNQNKWWYILLFLIFILVLIVLVIILIKMDNSNKKK